MSTRSYRYVHLDVFTNHLFGGNQLAVFLDARGLTGETMQALAKEMNFSESTFILPPEQQGTDLRMRIFTPGEELPMAGHPVIGSTFALAWTGVLTPPAGRVVFGLGVGPLPVDLTWTEGTLGFAWMTQLAPVFDPPIDDLAGAARMLGLEPRDIASTGLPIQAVSCGVPFLLVPVASREAVNRASMDLPAFHAFFAGRKPLGVFLFSTESGADGATAYSRMFAPSLGVAEDPATGSASGPLGSYLVQHGVVPAEQAGSMLSLQGVQMGRPSHIHMAIGSTAGAVTTVRVGGQAVVAGEGTIYV